MLLILLFSTAVPQSVATADCTGEQLARFPGGWPKTLDVGLYWFNLNDVSSKAVNGDKSEFYDPSRRTVIFFHGWAGSDGGWIKKCHRMTTRCPESVCKDGSEPLLGSWIEAGWNVGFFYWDQFADEECARDAEQKIWFDRAGDGLRWKSLDVNTGAQTHHTYLGDAMSVGDICVDAFWTALGGFSGPEVRFVGHSIGAQLAVRCAAMLHHQNHPAAPQRLAMLEPYFTKHHLWLFRCVGQTSISTDVGVGNFAPLATTDHAKHLYDTKGVVTEVYKSSVFTEMSEFGHPNKDLGSFSAYVEYEPRWCGGGGFAVGALAKVDLRHVSCRHYAAIPVYFLGFAQKPAPLRSPLSPEAAAPTSALASCPTPAASCSYGQLMQWVRRQAHLPEGQQQSWRQASGFDTLSVVDDTYHLTPRDVPANQFVEVAVLHSEWRPEDDSGALARVTTAVTVSRTPLVVLGVSALAVLALVVGRFRCGASPSEENQDEYSDVEGDTSITASLMDARLHTLQHSNPKKARRVAT